MKLMLIGHARHGKDTVAEMLSDILSFESSSMFAAKSFIFDQLKTKYGYNTVEECFEDRGNHREEWFNAIVNFNKDDLTALGKAIYKHHDIYVGLRNIDEYLALRDANVFDLTVWVDASERLPLEPATSMTLTKDLADYVIDNNQDLDNLEREVAKFRKLYLE